MRQALRSGLPLRRQARLAAAAAAGGLLVVAGSAAVAGLADVPFRALSKEPVETLGGPAYVGWMAHLGSVVWWAGAVAALLAGAVLSAAGRRERAGFLLAAGALTTALVADDLFLLHEFVYPRFLLPEEVVYAAYATALLAIAWRWHGEVLAHGALLVALAVGLWGGSVLMDAAQEHLGVHLHVVEDGLKLVGIAMWSVFLVGAAARELLALVGRDGAQRDHDGRAVTGASGTATPPAPPSPPAA